MICSCKFSYPPSGDIYLSGHSHVWCTAVRRTTNPHQFLQMVFICKSHKSNDGSTLQIVSRHDIRSLFSLLNIAPLMSLINPYMLASEGSKSVTSGGQERCISMLCRTGDFYPSSKLKEDQAECRVPAYTNSVCFIRSDQSIMAYVA